MGFGMGLLNITSVIMIQGSLEWSKRGSATASLIFSRTLGNTVGVAALGALLNFGVVVYAAEGGAAMDPDRVRQILTSIGNIAGGGTEPALQAALNQALHLAFWGMLAFAALAGVFSLLIPVRELETLAGGTHEAKKPEAQKETAPSFDEAAP